MTEKKKGRWLLPASLVLILAVVAAAMICAVTRPKPLPTPHEAMRKAVDSLEPLPDPVTLGVLGQGEMGGERFGVSGNLNLQTGKNGLELSLTDFTLGYEEGSTDLEVYINGEVAAVHIPELLGDTWYGVDFMKGLKVQATEVVSEELVDWYFDDGQLEEARAAIDELRAQLVGVHEIGLDSVDTMRLQTFFQQLSGETVRTENGYDLHFTASPPQVNTLLDPTGQIKLFTTQSELSQVVDITAHVDERQRLLGTDVTCDSFTLLFDLGDPDEPTPRLELRWGESKANSLELAFTVSEGTAFTAPKFTNAFDLLNLLSLGE